MKKFRPQGILPAMITPLAEDERIDERSLRKLINYEIGGGVHGIFAVGTTGEFYGLDVDTYTQLLSITVDEVGGRVPVYAGVNSIPTKECINLAHVAQTIGVDAISVLTPYFISLSQKELLAHYETIARNTDLPILIYDNAPRTHISIKPETVEKLADLPNIVGIKDSTGDMTNTAEHIRRNREKEFSVMIGRDTLIYSNLCYGGAGAVASCANVAPKLCVEIYEKFREGNLHAALDAQFKLAPLRLAFSMGSFPSVIKEALALLGLDSGRSISPIGPLSEEERCQLKNILIGMDILH